MFRQLCTPQRTKISSICTCGRLALRVMIMILHSLWCDDFFIHLPWNDLGMWHLCVYLTLPVVPFSLFHFKLELIRTVNCISSNLSSLVLYKRELVQSSKCRNSTWVPFLFCSHCLSVYCVNVSCAKKLLFYISTHCDSISLYDLSVTLFCK